MAIISSQLLARANFASAIIYFIITYRRFRGKVTALQSQGY